MKLNLSPFDMICLVVSVVLICFLLGIGVLPSGRDEKPGVPAEQKTAQEPGHRPEVERGTPKAPLRPGLAEPEEAEGARVHPEEMPLDPPPADQGAYLAEVADGILRLTNEFRQGEGLPDLLPDEALAAVARAHSEDMVVREFYSHENPYGLGPRDRIEAALGDRYYLATTAENIAYRSSAGSLFIDMPPGELARSYAQGWIDSPPHRENLLDPSLTHIGIGVSRSDTVDRNYGTQKFMRYLVRKDEPELVTDPGSGPVARFRANRRAVSPGELIVKVALPDATARWYADDRSYFTGAAYPAPRWIDGEQFDVALPAGEYGPGLYRLHFGNTGGTKTFETFFEYAVP